MTEFVRVSLPESKTEATVSRGWAEANKLKILDEPATFAHGKPLPPTRAGGRPLKPKTTVAAKKAAANVAVADPDPETSSASAGGKSGGVAAKPEEATK